jgi:hypothetical protein
VVEAAPAEGAANAVRSIPWSGHRQAAATVGTALGPALKTAVRWPRMPGWWQPREKVVWSAQHAGARAATVVPTVLPGLWQLTAESV